MSKTNIFLLILSCFFIVSCGPEEQEFPVEVRYWTPEHYSNAIRTIKFKLEPKEQVPSLDNAQYRAVFQKLVDDENYRVVLNDEELGLSHRNNVAQEFFDNWKDLTEIYSKRDRKDQYIHEEEMLKTWHFGLGLQIIYFDLGNQSLIQNSDDPESARTRNALMVNTGTLIDNYTIYLDEVNREEAFTESGLTLYATGLRTHFNKLIDLHPNADYRNMVKKIDLMYAKSNSETVKSALEEIKAKVAGLTSES